MARVATRNLVKSYGRAQGRSRRRLRHQGRRVHARADLAFSAGNADAREARLLQIEPGRALLVLKRTTWNDLGPITTVRLVFRPGHAMTADA